MTLRESLQPERGVALALGLGAFLALAGLACSPAGAKWVALAAIDEYRAEISPVKGYHCAYATLHGGATCSAYGRQVIRERGLLAGWALLRARFRECQDSGRRLAAREAAPIRHAAAGAGNPRLPAL